MGTRGEADWANNQAGRRKNGTAPSPGAGSRRTWPRVADESAQSAPHGCARFAPFAARMDAITSSSSSAEPPQAPSTRRGGDGGQSKGAR